MNRLVAASLATLLAGCSLALKFKECEVDDDCKARSDQLFCTKEKFCSQGPPLCAAGLYGAPPGGNTVMIAGLYRLSGASGDKDTEMAQAAQLAIEQIAGVSQRPIGLVLCDTAGDFVVAQNSLRKALLDYKIVGAVGPPTSGQVLGMEGVGAAAFSIANGLVLISPSATNPNITELSDNGLIWRTAASDNFQAVKLAQIVTPMAGSPPHVSVVSTVYVNSQYGSGLNSAFVSELQAQRGLSTRTMNPFPTGVNPDMDIVPKLAADTPDFALIVADEDAASIAQALYRTTSPALANTIYMFTDGAKGPSLIGTAPPAAVAARIRGTGPATPSGPVYDIFRSKYTNRFGSDPSGTSFVANSYDATFALAMAIAGSPADAPVSGATISSALKRMSVASGTRVNVNPETDFTKGASQLAMGGAIELTGTSGPLTWDPNTGDLVDAPLEVWGINGTTKTFCNYEPVRTCP